MTTEKHIAQANEMLRAAKDAWIEDPTTRGVLPQDALAAGVIADLLRQLDVRGNPTSGIWALLHDMRHYHGLAHPSTLAAWAERIEAHVLGGDPLIEKAKRNALAHALVNVAVLTWPERANERGMIEMGLAVDVALLAMPTASSPRIEALRRLENLRDSHRFNVAALRPCEVHAELVAIEELIAKTTVAEAKGHE